MTLKIHNPKAQYVRLGDNLYDISNNILWVVTDLHRLTYSIEYTITYLDRELTISHAPYYPVDGYVLIRKIYDITKDN